VRAVSASRVAGDPAPAVAFKVDSMPPVVTVPAATTTNIAGMVCASFTAVDNSRPCSGTDHDAVGGDGDGDGAGCSVSCRAAGAHDWKPCVSPACYAPLPAAAAAAAGTVAAASILSSNPALAADATSASNSALTPAPTLAPTPAPGSVEPPAGAVGWCTAISLTLEVLAVDAAGNRAEASVRIVCDGSGDDTGGPSSPLDTLPISLEWSIGIIASVSAVLALACFVMCFRSRRQGGAETASTFDPAPSSHSRRLDGSHVTGGGKSLGLPPPTAGAVASNLSGETPSRQLVLAKMEGPTSPASPQSSDRARREIRLPAVICEGSTEDVIWPDL